MDFTEVERRLAGEELAKVIEELAKEKDPIRRAAIKTRKFGLLYGMQPEDLRRKIEEI